MKLLQEFVNQASLQTSDGSDAGSTDVNNKGAEVKFDLMRNTINSDGKVKGSDVANYLERAHELNDEVETVLYGLETSDGDIVKVYVNATQADSFEAEMKKMLGMEDDIEEAIANLASKFDIVDVIWPEGTKDEKVANPEDEVDLDLAADLGDPSVEDEDDDMETIASVDDVEATPQNTDDEAPIEGEEDLPADGKKKDKKSESDKDKEEDEEESETEGEGEGEAEGETEGEAEGETEGSEEEPEKKEKKDKKKGDKHSLLKSIGGGLAGKEKVAEGRTIADVVNSNNLNAWEKRALKFDTYEEYQAFCKRNQHPMVSKKAWGLFKDALRKKAEKVTEGEVIHAKFGKPEEKKEYLSMLQAFGSRDLAAADDAGIKLTEKPSYWEDFEGDGYAAKRNLTDISLKKLEKTVGKLKTYSGKDIYGTDAKPRGPLAKVVKMPAEDMFIVKFDDGSRYVADQTGASTYIRMWQKIN